MYPQCNNSGTLALFWPRNFSSKNFPLQKIFIKLCARCAHRVHVGLHINYNFNTYTNFSNSQHFKLNKNLPPFLAMLHVSIQTQQS
jgi:hypothetical protein